MFKTWKVLVVAALVIGTLIFIRSFKGAFSAASGEPKNFTRRRKVALPTPGIIFKAIQSLMSSGDI